MKASGLKEDTFMLTDKWHLVQIAYGTMLIIAKISKKLPLCLTVNDTYN